MLHGLRYNATDRMQKHINGASSLQWSQDTEICKMGNNATFLIMVFVLEKFVFLQKHVISVSVQWVILLKYVNTSNFS